MLRMRSGLSESLMGEIMIGTRYLPAVDSTELDAILADALILNWSDLMPELASGRGKQNDGTLS